MLAVPAFLCVQLTLLVSIQQVPDTIHKLGATTFVAAVTASTLSLLVPLLVRGLRDRATPIKRKSCLVIDNMSKLVNNPADAAVFLPRLLPGLDAVRKEVSNPECREVADRAHATLLRVGAKGKVSTPTVEDKAAEAKVDSPPCLCIDAENPVISTCCCLFCGNCVSQILDFVLWQVCFSDSGPFIKEMS